MSVASVSSTKAGGNISAAEDTVRQQRIDSVAQGTLNQNPWTERKIISVILSTVIPGSGQTYLGHTEKGAAFTISTIASALIAGLSENNVIGRNERLDELKIQYGLSSSYIAADTTWSKMVSTKSILDKDIRRRDLFLKITAVLWIANLVDVIFFTDDSGEKAFGLLKTESTTIALVPNYKNGVNALLTVRF
ncbi:MAG: hypothetical protein HY088_07870 [Ignavibacteriales bacterium]|nr:hypothetical protein [Ignavibacteriales bacterium]